MSGNGRETMPTLVSRAAHSLVFVAPICTALMKRSPIATRRSVSMRTVPGSILRGPGPTAGCIATKKSSPTAPVDPPRPRSSRGLPRPLPLQVRTREAEEPTDDFD